MAEQKYGVIFDLDGTMWNSVDGVRKSWSEVLLRHGKEALTLKQTEAMMGSTLGAIMESLTEGESTKTRSILFGEMSAREIEVLSAEGGRLYPGLEDTLSRLRSEGYSLYIVSNCQCGYIECFLGYSGLGKYFDRYECYGSTGLEKGDNIKLLCGSEGLTGAVYIGDTERDCKACEKAGVPFIWASYGFGNVPDAKNSIKELSELPDIICKIIKNT